MSQAIYSTLRVLLKDFTLPVVTKPQSVTTRYARIYGSLGGNHKTLFATSQLDVVNNASFKAAEFAPEGIVYSNGETVFSKKAVAEDMLIPSAMAWASRAQDFRQPQSLMSYVYILLAIHEADVRASKTYGYTEEETSLDIVPFTRLIDGIKTTLGITV
jgi:hypothetical protein